MKKLNLTTLAILCILSGSAQVKNPVDSFFRYYCKVYKTLLDRNGGKNLLKVMDKTSGTTYKQENNPLPTEAKNQIKQQYHIKDDKEAMMKFVEINSERFLRTAITDLSNKQVIIKKYDTIYRLFNSFLCNCLAKQTKGIPEQEIDSKEDKIFQDCMLHLRTSPAGIPIRNRTDNLNQAQRVEMAEYLSMYMYTHCANAIADIVRNDKKVATGLYNTHLRWEAYNMINKVEKYIQRTDTITTIELYFENPAAYKTTVPQLNAWRKALQVKYYTGRSYNYRYDLKNLADYYKIYSQHTSDGTDIAFMIKYSFKDDKIASITYIDGDQVPQKKQVLHDMYAGKRYDEDIKINN